MPGPPQIDYAQELNPRQLAAVTALPGPALVIAGAGSGKTRTLVYRVAYLLEQGIPPEHILLLTFTNKAAREMMRRVADRVAQETGALWGGTFHAIGNRILRRHAALLGYAEGFTVLDRDDALELLRACRADWLAQPGAAELPKAEVIAEIWSLAQNTRQSVAALLEVGYPHLKVTASALLELQQRYTARKRAQAVMDFDDLLVQWRVLLEDQPAVRDLYQRRFQFILVDEYQDTNRLQNDILELMAARHHGIMAVGDDAQSIYSWRGADLQNILQFPARHPGTQVFTIETNYRSTPEILAVANAVIAPNLQQYPKVLTPVQAGGAKPRVAVCGDGRLQAAYVAHHVVRLVEEGLALEEIAVLYRSHFHALELQMELTRRQIPFHITSGLRFFEQAHIKDLTAYLRLVHNPLDELAFKRLARMLPGVGAKAAERLWGGFQAAWLEARRTSVAARAAGAPAAPASSGGSGAPPEAGRPPVGSVLQGLVSTAPARARAGWGQLASTLEQLETSDPRLSVAAMLALVLEAGYEEYLEANYTNYRHRREDLEQLVVAAGPFSSLAEFLTQLALLSNVEAEHDYGGREEGGRLHLSTVHQAKGLEFAVVFVIMLCDSMFPSHRAAQTREGEEEERRLFYVAVTRAKNELYLSYPLVRVVAGGEAPWDLRPSRFLAPLGPELVEREELVY